MTPEPLYQMIVEQVHRDIQDGLLQPAQKAPSIVQLRQRFSVSTITASRALQELALGGDLEKLPGRGYFVSSHRSASRRNPCVGCLLRANYVSLDDHYFNEIISGIQQAAALAKVDLLWSHLSQQLCQMHITLHEEIIEAAQDMGDRVDGFLLDERIPDHIVQHILTRTGKPAVIVNRPTTLPIPSVSPNYRQGLLDLRKTLLQMQYGKFIFACSQGNSYGAMAKGQFFRETVETYGLPQNAYRILPEITAVPIGVTYDRLRQAMEELKPGKLALVSSCDSILGELLDLLRQDGLSIPQDLGIVATDGLTLTATHRPVITTLKTDTVRLGQKAMELLLKELSGTAYEPTQTFLLTQNFVLGETL